MSLKANIFIPTVTSLPVVKIIQIEFKRIVLDGIIQDKIENVLDNLNTNSA
jgi:hypothetical protein